LRPERDESLEVETTYISSGAQWLGRLLGILSMAGKTSFLLLLVGLLIAMGYKIYAF